MSNFPYETDIGMNYLIIKIILLSIQPKYIKGFYLFILLHDKKYFLI